MARLSSFSFLFQYIPRPVSALDCAKHGWKDTRAVTEKDENVCVLSCDTCKDNMFVIDCDYKRCDPQKGIFSLSLAKYNSWILSYKWIFYSKRYQEQI